MRGGLLLGVDVDLALTPRFTLPLQMRDRLQRPGRVGPTSTAKWASASADAGSSERGGRYGCGFGVDAGALPAFSPGSWNERSTVSFTSVDTG